MKFAIIGCGKQAPKHISGLLEHDKVDHIFVSDLFHEQAEQLADKYDEKISAIPMENVFATAEIDAVIITTPTGPHFQLCKNAIEAGKPFLVEKPLVSTLQQAREILNLSEEKNVPGMVGFIYRFSPIFDKIKTVLSQSDPAVLGNTEHALFRIAGRGSHQPWKHQKDKMGGAINEMMVHMIDLAVWYFGDAADIQLLDKEIVRPERQINGETVVCDAEDWCVARLTMADGTRVLIQSDMTSPAFKQYIEVNGENGIIEGSIQPNYQDAITLSEARGGFEKGHKALAFDRANLYVDQTRCFIEMAISRSEPAKCTLREAVEVMRIQEKLHAA